MVPVTREFHRHQHFQSDLFKSERPASRVNAEHIAMWSGVTGQNDPLQSVDKLIRETSIYAHKRGNLWTFFRL